MAPAAGALLERDEETAAIDAALTAAAAGSGRFVVLRGPAGIGKSRLLDSAADRARDKEMKVLRARGGELERDFAFGVARQLFEPALFALDAPARAAVLDGAAALSAPAIGLGEEQRPDVGDRLFAVMHGTYWLCANLAALSPLAILIDDVQWADEQSLRWLAYLARRLDDVAVLVVLAVRAEDNAEPSGPLTAIRGELTTGTFELAPLGTGAVGRLITETAGVTPAAEVVRACHRRSAGNPFVLREIVASLTESGLALDEPQSAQAVDHVLPDTVARGVLRRLAALDGSATALACSVAVLGTDVQLMDAARLADLGDDAAAGAMDALVDAGFLLPELPLRFVHPLMREAIYADLPAGRRRVQHRRAAEVLDARIAPELIGAHLLECEPTGDQHSVAILRRCGARAMSRGAPEVAVRYLSRALAERPDPDVLAPIVRELGIAEARLGRLGAVAHLEEALRLSETAADACAATCELAWALAARGGWADAATVLERGIDALADRNRELELRLVGELCAIGQLDTSWTARVAARLRRVAPDLEGRTPSERLVLAAYAHLRSNEDATADELAGLAGRALGDGLLLSEQTSDSPAFYLLVYVLHRAERDDLVDAWLKAALEDARARGSLFGTSIGLAVRGQLRWVRGQLPDAEADARMSLDAQLEAGWTSVLPLAVHVLAECLLERGAPQEALQLFEQSGLSGELPDLQMSRWAQATRGRVRIACGRVAEGLADLLDCEREQVGTHGELRMLWRTDAALALAARGQHDRARELAGEQLDLSRGTGIARVHGVALRTMGLLCDGADARRYLSDAVEVLAPSSSRLEYARALVDLGSFMRRSGSPAASREPLRDGYELARSCGASQLAGRASAELAAAGVRLRRPALSGLDALTPSERRVAEMAASGMSNPDIAQALFLTRKTIEMHLGRAYRKLAVGGRSELAVALGNA